MKFFVLIYKDTLLMLKDRAGLVLMFLMPLVLVLVMTLLQDNTFRAVSESRINLLLLNEDDGALGKAIETELKEKEIFNLQQRIDGAQLTEESLKAAVARGDYHIGLVIPNDTTEKLQDAVSRAARQAFQDDRKSLTAAASQIEILIYIDPATKDSYKISMMSSIREMAAELKQEVMISEVLKMISEMYGMPPVTFQMPKELLRLKETYASDRKDALMPNSVQHNVPAWTLFAMFFIIISLAGNMINERSQGSYSRLLTLPVSFSLIIGSKVVVYFIICLIQFLLMLLMGMNVLPWFGLPALEIGHSVWGLALIVSASALAAVGYSVFVGVAAETYHQVSSFGAISVVILSAIGGIWVPVFAMPRFMQLVSRFSPLNWGIEGFYDIFIRDGDVASVLPNAAALITFASAGIIGAVLYSGYRRRQA